MGKRPDRAKRLADNRNSNFFTVSVSLVQATKRANLNAADKALLLEHIESNVMEFSHIAQLSTIFTQYYLSSLSEEELVANPSLANLDNKVCAEQQKQQQKANGHVMLQHRP
jgi:hypothetical protein